MDLRGKSKILFHWRRLVRRFHVFRRYIVNRWNFLFAKICEINFSKQYEIIKRSLLLCEQKVINVLRIPESARSSFRRASLVTISGLFAIVILVRFYGSDVQNAISQTFTFSQTSWSGGVSTGVGSHAVSDTTSTYSAKDANLTIVNAGTNLQLTTSTFYVTSTDDGTGNTGFNLSGSGHSFTQVVGTGNSASIKLQPASSVGGTGADGAITVSSLKNINTSTISGSRTCADGIAYNVISLTATSATVSTTPAAGCLANGDQVILINLQGDGTVTTTVGNYEFLTVQSVSSNVINFTTSKTKYYGNAANSDANIGTSTTKQKVVVQRVPQYTDVTINNGGTLTASAWDGQKGGLLVYYANGTTTIQSGGNITMSTRGYGGGRAKITGSGEQGASINGTSTASTLTNFGGGGGSQYDGFCGYSGYGPGGAGYATAGGSNGNAQGGLTYGDAALIKLHLGSGSGGDSAIGSPGGGAIYINSNKILNSGSITNNGANYLAGGSGGSIYLTGSVLSLAADLVTAQGGPGGVGYFDTDCMWNGGGAGGNGRVYIKSNSITGSTLPAATTGALATTYYSSGVYTSGIIDLGVNVVAWKNLSWNASGGQTITLKARSSNSATMVGAPAFSTCTNITNGNALTTGGCVTDGDRYIQYEASLSTGDTSVTPSLDDVTISYTLYNSSATLTSIPFDSGDSANVMGSVNWTEDTNVLAGTGVTVSLRTANNGAMTGATAWQDFTRSTSGCSKVSGVVACPNAALPSIVKDSSNDQYFQYKITLTSSGSSTPTVSAASMQFVINLPPEIQNVSAVQNSDGTVTISYEVRDPDTALDTGSENALVPSFQYCPGGVSCAAIADAALSVGATSSKYTATSTWNTYTATWTPTVDKPGVWDAAAKIKVIVSDAQAANATANSLSSAFALDSKPPAATSIRVDASTTPAVVYLGATDNTGPIQMRFASSAGGLSSATYVAFTGTTTMTLGTNPATVYVQFKDAKNNETGAAANYATTPEMPANFMVQDTTNFKNDPPDYREFLAWKTITVPGPGFSKYQIYRSTGPGDCRFTACPWTLAGTNLTDVSFNFFSDITTPALTEVYYKVLSVDLAGNTSFNSAVLKARPDGIQNFDEGGGGTGIGPVISNITTSSPAASSITVSWDTDILSNSTVSYSTSEGVFSNAVTVGSMVNDGAHSGQHSVILANLAPDTAYYFSVKSTDVNGNYTIDNNSSIGYSFHTTPGPIITAGPSPATVYNTSATITWQTSLPANATIFYSTSQDFSSASSTSDLVSFVTSHTLTLTGLIPSQTYYYYVRSIDGSGNVVYDQNVHNGVAMYYSFPTTNDQSPPVITNASAAVNTTTAAITWHTDKNADTQVVYGLTSGYGSSTVLDAYQTNNHAATLPGLTPNTIYHYQILSRDGNGNLATSVDLTFLTGTPVDTTPPIISNVTTSSISLSQATINWVTSKNTNATVDYGTTPQFGSLSGSLYDFSTSTHSVTLTGLLGNTMYYFRANALDINGNSATSSVYTFITQADVTPPAITASSTLVNDTAAFVNWNTDELTMAQINYGISESFGVTVEVTSTYATAHSLALTGLSPETTYYYQIVTADPSSNTTTAGTFTLTTSKYGASTMPQTPSSPSNVPAPTIPPTITNVVASNITAMGATISWTTDMDSNSLVKYGITSNYSSLAGDEINLATTHAVLVTNLRAGTTYRFRAKSQSAQGQWGVGNEMTFTTLNEDGTEAAPTTAETASIEQQNQALLDSIMEAPVKLLASILKAFAKNPAIKDIPEDTLAATVADIADRVVNAPTIVGLKPIVEVKGNVATIRWSTDKKTTGLVSYAKESEFKPTTDKPYVTTVVDTGENTVSAVHFVELTNLDPGTLYHFQVASKGEIGPEGKSKDYTFQTEAILPVITDAKVGDVTESTVTVSWKTNIPSAATIEYTNTKTNTTLTVGDTSFVTSHGFTVKDLEPGAPYNLVVKAKNETGNEVISPVLTFTTTLDTLPPEIINLSSNSTLYPGQNSKVQTIISWETNKQATGQVFYKEGVGGQTSSTVFSSQYDPSLNLRHIVVLTNFKPGTVYQYWVESTSTAGNHTKSNVFSVLTPIEKQTIIDIIGKNFQGVFGWTKNLGI